MTTQRESTPKDISVFQTFADFLKDIWKNDGERPDIYVREQQFSYFWDNRDSRTSHLMYRLCYRCKIPIRFMVIWNGVKSKWIALNLDGSVHKYVFLAEGPT